MSSGASDGSGVQYSVIFVNNSSHTGNVCIYQQDPGITIPEVMSLAWLVQPAASTTPVTFTWGIGYDFVWARTGVLSPGLLFVANQTWPANLSSQNRVTFSNQGFRNQQQGPQPGNLYIDEDGTIPSNELSVGIGMSGYGTFAVQAQSDTNLVFTPSHPQYWITLGTWILGEVMAKVKNPALIAFPPNVYSMAATLNADDTWTIVPSFQASA